MGTTASQKMRYFSGSQPVGHLPFGGLNDLSQGSIIRYLHIRYLYCSIIVAKLQL